MSEPAFTKYMELLFQNKLEDAYEECIDAINRSSSTDKPKHEVHLCHILNSLGRYTESYEILRRLVLAGPDDHRILHNWGAVKRMMGQYKEALATFRKEQAMIDRGDPENALSIAANEYELSKTNHMMGETEAAIVHAGRCLIFSEKCDDPIMHGCAYRMLGDLLVGFSEKLGFSAYETAKEKFAVGEDPRAIEDVDLRMKSVVEGRDPKFVS